MSSRSWWTVVLSAIAGPVGSIGLGVGLARLADATTGGMASLAGGVVGLWLGAPLLVFIVFAVCLVTVARPLPLRRWLALLIMLAAVIVEAFIVLIGLRIAGSMATPEIGLVVVAFVAIGVLGAGAHVALSIAQRRSTLTEVDPARPISAESAD